MSEQELQLQIDSINETLRKWKLDPPIGEHEHTGFDVTKVDYKNIAKKKVYITHTIYGTGAATAANYGVFCIVPVACVLTGFQEVHQTAGTDGGTVSVTLEKLTGTQAPDGGAVMLTAALSLKATINSVQDGTPTITNANRSLIAGDRLCLKDAGTLTSVANVTVKVELTVI